MDKIPFTMISDTASDLAALIDQIRSDIPDKRRISTGRYSIVKSLGDVLHPLLEDPFRFGVELFEVDGDPFTRSLGLQLLSLAALEKNILTAALSHFEAGAADADWIVRECASGLFRKLIKAYPEEIRTWYLELVHSPDPNHRRFISESLRPVVENRWFHKEPEYALGVIRHLFQEEAPYPRTSLGNNLSDWMRVDHEVTWPIIQELARSGDPNSYWIAYRACRNHVKKNPVLVMETLAVEEYKYKNRLHKLEDYQ